MSLNQNALLNQILIRLHRSLLQYVGECWPWVGAAEGSTEQQTIEGLVGLRQAEIARLAELLANRSWPIDFGVYPTEYTDLHYVALDFLIGQLIVDTDTALTQVTTAAGNVGHDPEAQKVLEGILVAEREIGKTLRELQAQPKVAYAF